MQEGEIEDGYCPLTITPSASQKAVFRNHCCCFSDSYLFPQWPLGSFLTEWNVKVFDNHFFKWARKAEMLKFKCYPYTVYELILKSVISLQYHIGCE